MSDQDAAGAVAGILGVMLFVYLAVILLVVVSMWVIFAKAGKPGWAAIIPFYNIIVLLEIVGRPLWWIVLFLLPFVSFVMLIIVDLDLAKSFKKSTGFAVGLILLPFVFMPMLAFGDSKYEGPAAAQA